MKTRTEIMAEIIRNYETALLYHWNDPMRQITLDKIPLLQAELSEAEKDEAKPLDPWPEETELRRLFYEYCALPMKGRPPMYDEKFKVIPYQVWEWIRVNIVYPMKGFDPNKKWNEVMSKKDGTGMSVEVMPKDIDVFLSQYAEREWLKIHGDLHDLLPFFKKCVRPAMRQYAAQHTQMPTEEIYDIDFDGHLKAGIIIDENGLEIIGAVNGWGNGISRQDIRVTKREPKS